MLNELLARIIDAHGGMDRWNSYEKVEATIVSGGGFFPVGGVVQDADNSRPSRVCPDRRRRRKETFRLPECLMPRSL
jgi:hypothetical protein